jgi:7-cyano-7-deazaguanine synthase
MNKLMNKLILHSGGMDSTAVMLKYIRDYGVYNIISLGFDYGQRHFKMENEAAERFCINRGIKRIVLDVPIGQIGGCSLVDRSIPVTTNMVEQRSTVVPMRNGIFLMLASAVAQVNGCDTIVHGACDEDYEAYRDCRIEFFRLLELAIQAGITNPKKGSEHIFDDINVVEEKHAGIPYIEENKIDIRIEMPLILEKKEETMKWVLQHHDVSVYAESYTCYNGEELSCGKCPACQERLLAFKVNRVTDPLKYKE